MGIVTRIKEDLGLPITSLTVRITDTALGSPAVGVHLSVTAPDGHTLNGRTDEFGSARVDDGLIPGRYSVVLEVGQWFAAHDRPCGYGDVVIQLDVTSGSAHDITVSLAGYAYSVTLEPNTYQPPAD
jgi:5-hydroxyisourate hydrolase-like protein (transthyretin family)